MIRIVIYVYIALLAKASPIHAIKKKRLLPQLGQLSRAGTSRFTTSILHCYLSPVHVHAVGDMLVQAPSACLQQLRSHIRQCARAHHCRDYCGGLVLTRQALELQVSQVSLLFSLSNAHAQGSALVNGHCATVKDYGMYAKK
jgi:hypothetical protein